MGSVVSLSEDAIRALVARSVIGGVIRNNRLYLQRDSGTELDAGPVGGGGVGGGGVPVLIRSAAEWEVIKPGLSDTLYVVIPGLPGTVSPWTIEADFDTPGTPFYADTGQPLVVVSGSWTAADGGIKSAADGGILGVDLGSKTQTFEVGIKGSVIASSFPTLIFRYDPSNGHHYRLGKHNTSEMLLARRDPNSSDVLKTPTGVFPTSGDVVIRGEISGDAPNTIFRFWVNGVEVKSSVSGAPYVEGVGFTDTDTTPPVGTIAAVRYAFISAGGSYSYDFLRAAARKNVGA